MKQKLQDEAKIKHYNNYKQLQGEAKIAEGTSLE